MCEEGQRRGTESQVIKCVKRDREEGQRVKLLSV